MIQAKRLVEGMLQEAGVQLDGPNPWDIHVKDERLFERVLRWKNLGLGEAYMDGWWECPRVDEFICRILKAKLDERLRFNIRDLPHLLPALFVNLQSKGRVRLSAEAHYDRDTELFMSFLDPFNQYSCAYFNGTGDLNEAQERKLDLICRKIDLKPGDRVLDIGCGWGGFARYAAERYGCVVTAINVCRDQIRYAREFCRDLPVLIMECDYRDCTETFHKIVSIGMFEHVGYRNYRLFMRCVRRCLNDDGIFLLQTIGSNQSRVRTDPWIGTYIFPDSMLPSIAQIGRAIEGLFVMEDWHNLGPHYDRTLMAWYRNFQGAWERLRKRFDDRFRRMWEYYLLSCAGAFRARSIQLWQIVLTPCGRAQPACRL
ncbi:MAG: cyclopropane fatty acyl phospholipid synthase [Deltaproteobacteria bacterium]|nr:cyclopropane fatty acyl phospholipid synthase [Deltaproteobacteria bacterium]